LTVRGPATIISLMAQLILENVEESLIRRLEALARKDGISVAEEHQRLLETALAEKAGTPQKSVLEHILAIPKASPDEAPGLFDRQRVPRRKQEKEAYEPPLHLDRVQYLLAMPKASEDEPEGLFVSGPDYPRELDLE
jgi:hypothetical protein